MAPQGSPRRRAPPPASPAYQAGPGASLLTLDKGSSDGIRRTMVVTACSTTTAGVIPQASILGAVDGVWAKTCTVRLLTDPHMKMLSQTRSPLHQRLHRPHP